VPELTVEHVFATSAAHWKATWESGAALDLAGSTDPRAPELERRVVLSQWIELTQEAGSLPPQETGLISNSWYGKFHGEMIWFHLLHYFGWGRGELAVNATLPFWKDATDASIKHADSQGYAGARWPKMTGPTEGMLIPDGPSGVGPLLVWEQPHPIIFAEMAYRSAAAADAGDGDGDGNDRHTQAVLADWNRTVHLTADFMAAFVLQAKGFGGPCMPLGPPICGSEIECGEDFPDKTTPPELQTKTPTFETTYFRYAFKVAQSWRTRLGLAEDATWAEAASGMCTPQPKEHGGNQVYWPEANSPNFTAGSSAAQLYAVAYAPLGNGINEDAMRTTMAMLLEEFNFENTWGCDFQAYAIAAARLGNITEAMNFMMSPVAKNAYLPNGCQAQANWLQCYTPANGALLASTAMLAGGWDGGPKDLNDRWPDGFNVAAEGFLKMY